MLYSMHLMVGKALGFISKSDHIPSESIALLPLLSSRKATFPIPQETLPENTPTAFYLAVFLTLPRGEKKKRQLCF
jgi:hypothetical protein